MKRRLLYLVALAALAAAVVVASRTTSTWQGQQIGTKLMGSAGGAATRNWKVYADPDVQFRYPDDPQWTLYRGTGRPPTAYDVRVACWVCGDATFAGFSLLRIPFQSLDAYLASRPDDIASNPMPLDRAPTTVDGLPATALLVPPFQGIGMVRIFLTHRGRGYILTLEGYTTASNRVRDLPALRPDILSTVRFQR